MGVFTNVGNQNSDSRTPAVKTVDSRKKLDAKANKLDTTGGNETKRQLSLMNEIKHFPTVQTRKKNHSKVNCGALC